MSTELAAAMEECGSRRWTQRGIWSQWFDAAKHAGFSDGEAARFATDKDEDLRTLERRIESDRERLRDLVSLGAETPPFRSSVAGSSADRKETGEPS